MKMLRTCILIVAATPVFFSSSCKDKAVYHTPTELVEVTRNHYLNNEPEKFLASFSEAAREAIHTKAVIVREQFNKIDPRYLAAIAEKTGIKPERISKMDDSDYVTYTLLMEQKRKNPSSDLLFPADRLANENLIDETINENNALLHYQNEISVELIKNDGLWYIDKITLPEPEFIPGNDQ